MDAIVDVRKGFEHIHQGICWYHWFARVVKMRVWVLIEDIVQFVFNVGDGLPVPAISGLLSR